VSTPGQTGVGEPNATWFAVFEKSVCCWSPLVVTDPTCDSMFCRAE
jgi:hypothetical protein